MGNKIRLDLQKDSLKSGVGRVSSWMSFRRSSRSVSNRLISHPINATRDLIARRYIIYPSGANWSATRMPLLLHRLRPSSSSLLKLGDFNAWTHVFVHARVIEQASVETNSFFLRLRPFGSIFCLQRSNYRGRFSPSWLTLSIHLLNEYASVYIYIFLLYILSRKIVSFSNTSIMKN